MILAICLSYLFSESVQPKEVRARESTVRLATPFDFAPRNF